MTLREPYLFLIDNVQVSDIQKKNIYKICDNFLAELCIDNKVGILYNE